MAKNKKIVNKKLLTALIVVGIVLVVVSLIYYGATRAHQNRLNQLTQELIDNSGSKGVPDIDKIGTILDRYASDISMPESSVISFNNSSAFSHISPSDPRYADYVAGLAIQKAAVAKARGNADSYKGSASDCRMVQNAICKNAYAGVVAICRNNTGTDGLGHGQCSTQNSAYQQNCSPYDSNGNNSQNARSQCRAALPADACSRHANVACGVNLVNGQCPAGHSIYQTATGAAFSCTPDNCDSQPTTVMGANNLAQSCNDLRQQANSCRADYQSSHNDGGIALSDIAKVKQGLGFINKYCGNTDSYYVEHNCNAYIGYVCH